MSLLNYIDLFAGAGGLSEGFIREKFEPIAHVEMSAEAADTLKTRIAFHHFSQEKNLTKYYGYLQKDISRNELWDSIPKHLLESVINEEISDNTIENIFEKIDSQIDSKKVDVIIGGPPCQTYSLVGRSRDPNRMKGDKRNFLFRYYAKFLIRYKPKYFVFENVLGLLTAGNAKYLNEMLELFGEIGYSADIKVLNAEEYGVLQKRRRVIIIGRKGKTKFHFPELEKIENNWQTKRDLFFDLPYLKPGQELEVAVYTKNINEYLKKTETRNGINFTTQHVTRNHNERDLEIYAIAIDKWLNDRQRLKYTDIPKRLQTHKNTEAFLDRYKVIDPNGHSHTVVAHIAKDGHYYIYPDLEQVRSISVREAARIQSFPDDYYFEGGRTSAFKQIGNAVPPLMAEKIARAIKTEI
ncbi:DNA cytosine methyltransferase [Sphingobacteriales bacterium UPWRP_1]|nr:DNA (cytosine-5-)-methyltransferase [Sphingobacteriales bacterium TSM_CSM]PSJ76317.1 DNA cytosine methyltransferase [Sphingobacteriales bacterium UPWRP_1]